ncbi:MAG TPA: hypothetical protein VKP59_00680 [Candidatus Thermoplasmatota archaeon]|nr:hypothetical protein [Candidatus Thermoplasmatota archaeon]
MGCSLNNGTILSNIYLIMPYKLSKLYISRSGNIKKIADSIAEEIHANAEQVSNATVDSTMDYFFSRIWLLWRRTKSCDN